MKFINIIKLLSVLLCIGMLFVACDDSNSGNEETSTQASTTEAITEAPTEIPTDEPLLENVETKFENFFEMVKETNELTTVEEIEGDIIAYSNKLCVLMTKDIDTKNNVTETYTVYNLITGNTVLTETNTYFNGIFDDFDWNDLFVHENTIVANDKVVVEDIKEKNYPGCVLSVEIQNEHGIDYIIVRRADIKTVDEATRNANPDGCVYEISTKYAYYDMNGVLITETNSAVTVDGVEDIISMGTTEVIVFGSVTACFDAKTGALVSTSSYDNGHVKKAFAHENDRYGYYFAHETNISNIGSVKYIDIYDKITGKSIRYHFDKAYEQSMSLYLNNGDIFIQYFSLVDEDEPYDIISKFDNNDAVYLQVKQVILSVDDGKTAEIDIPYVVSALVSADSLEKNPYKVNGYQLSVTENARNIAQVYRVDGGRMSDSIETVVFDNDMSVLYICETLIDNQKMTESQSAYILGYKPLGNGDRLVYVDHGIFTQAIVRADGTVRSYLTSSMEIVGEYIVDNEIIYDYDLNRICDYTQEDLKSYNIAELFGRLVFRKNDRVYYLDIGESGKAVLTDVFEEEGYVEHLTEDYVVFYDAKTQKHTLYNESLTALLKTNDEMHITKFEGGYLVRTRLYVQEKDDYKTYIYIVK